MLSLVNDDEIARVKAELAEVQADINVLEIDWSMTRERAVEAGQEASYDEEISDRLEALVEELRRLATRHRELANDYSRLRGL
jgi:uncharacterized small protein (DUF1192 family)